MQSPQVERPLSSLQGLGPSCDTTTQCNIHTRLLISGFPLYRPQLPHQLLFILKADFKCPLLRNDVLRCSQTRVAPLLSIPNAYFPAGLFSIETHRASSWATLVAQLVKILPSVRETWVQSLGWEDPLEKGKAAAKSLQSCLTLCDPIDGSPPAPPPCAFQERTLEWVAIRLTHSIF